ncbi:MAG: Fimbrial assembly family protein [Desulfotomaculum sp. 46_296]|nr:MAG: Fimbrial assembly family protein [Desulfotomaculum sp. 46_296]KUK84620.1 MAG: Fimbrial assembly family protein [Desulfofundulus kuznetsovii]
MIYKVNLLPPNLQHEGNIDIRRLLTISVVTFLATVLIFGYGFFVFNFLVMKKQLAEAQQQLANLSPIVARTEKIINERKKIEKTLDQYNSLIKKQVTWSDMFFDLNNVTPVDLWLNSMELSYKPDAKLTIGSSPVLTGNQNSERSAQAAGQTEAGRPNVIAFNGASLTISSIGVFMNNLYQLPYFQEVKLIKASRDSQGITFQITALLKDDL